MAEIEVPHQPHNVMYPAFLYDDARRLPRLFLFAKVTGFAFYIMITVSCHNKPPFSWFCMVLLGMFASICNMIRYECVFLTKRGTVFESVDEFHEWKMQQKPNIKHGLDFIELAFKIGIFINSLPLTFEIHDEINHDVVSICNTGTTVLKIHSLVIFIMCVIVSCFLGCIYINFPSDNSNSNNNNNNSNDNSNNNSNSNDNNGNGNSNNNRNVTHHINQLFALCINPKGIDTQTECCVCLDKTNQPWITMRCAHSFHATCITEWLQQNPSCPICRSQIDVV
jgi:hypothetical protein